MINRYMRLCVLLLCVPAGLAAQDPIPARADSAAMPVDSAAMRLDSLATDSLLAADSTLMARELERIRGEPRVAADPAAQQPSQNARMLPDISVVGDLVGDLSPDGSTQEDGARFGIREVELAVQAAVDPYFRGDVFLGISDAEGIAIEQAFLTTQALPWGLEARLGRFLMPVGKQTTTHRHDLHTVEYPYVIQSFFGPEGLKGTGIALSRVFAPFGFYQELQLTAVDAFGEPAVDADEEPLQPLEPTNRNLGGLGYSARLRNYVDISQNTNLELSGSVVTGLRTQPADMDYAEATGLTGINNRQTVMAADLTLRWRPLQQGLYRSFILQAEVMRQVNGVSDNAGYAGPPRDVSGAYAFARYQISQRAFLGARFDWLQELPERTTETETAESFTAASGYYEFFPSEFSKLMVAYERRSAFTDDDIADRILLQATFALGPHKPHPF